MGARRTDAFDVLIVTLLVLATAAIFANVLRHEFVMWDDDIEITNNPHIQQWSPANVRWMLTDTAQTMRYIPLSWLNWATLVSLFGLKPGWFHFEALLLHAANAVLVFYLIRTLLHLATLRSAALTPRTSSLIAGLGALTWAIHPLRSEVVAWTTQERFAQALFFFLIGLLVYLQFVREPGRSRGWLLGVSISSAALSALTYPTGALFAGVLLIVDVYPLERFKGPGRFWNRQARSAYLEKVPYVVVPALVWIVTVRGRLAPNSLYEPPPSLSAFSIPARIMQAFYIWAYYLWRPLVPVDLSPVYLRLVRFEPTEAPFVASLILVLVVTIMVVVVGRRLPALPALWVSHLFLLVPMLGIFEKPHYSSDRYAYAQGVLWSLLVAAGLYVVGTRLSKRSFGIACACVGGACLLLAALAWRQNLIWRDSITLFRYTIASIGDDPSRSDLHSRLGLAYLVRGGPSDHDAAVEELSRYPLPSDATVGAGWILLDRKMPDKAATIFRTRIESAPPTDASMPALHNGLGVALARLQNLSEAEIEFIAAIRLSPNYLEARSNLGQCLQAEGRQDLAIAQFRELVRLSNGNPNFVRLLDQALAAGSR